MTEELLKRLDALSAKLGVAAQALWGSYMKQAMINGWECMAAGVIFLTISAVCMAAFVYEHRRGDKNDLCTTAVVVALVSGIIAALFLMNAADYLFNPTVWAFHSIMQDLSR